MNRRSHIFAWLLALSALVIAGCGSSTPLARQSGAEVAAHVQQAVAAAHSYRIVGDATVDGLHEHLDFGVLLPSRASGTVTVDRARIRVVMIDDVLYEKRLAGGPFSSAAARRLSQAWIREPAGHDTALRTLFVLPEKLRPGADERNEGAARTHGQPVVRLAGTGVTVDIAATGPAYPVVVAGTAHGTRFDLRLGGWNRPLKVSAPRHSISAAAQMRRAARLDADNPVTVRQVTSSATAATGGERFSAPGYALHFDYPSALHPLPLRAISTGIVDRTHTAIGLAAHDLIIIGRTPQRSIEVNRESVKLLLPGLDAAISKRAGRQLHGRVAELAGHVAIEYPTFTGSADGERYPVRFTFVFAPGAVYDVIAQAQTQPAEIDQAYAEALRTLTIS